MLLSIVSFILKQPKQIHPMTCVLNLVSLNGRNYVLFREMMMGLLYQLKLFIVYQGNENIFSQFLGFYNQDFHKFAKAHEGKSEFELAVACYNLAILKNPNDYNAFMQLVE